MKILSTVVFTLFHLIGFSQRLIIQPPLFTPFDCTEFYKLYTGTITNFGEKKFETKLIIRVEYTSPSGKTELLADGVISGNPSIEFKENSTTIINNSNYESIYSNRKITFYNAQIENSISKSKCLIPGTYDVCLTLVDANSADNSQDFLTQTCYTREKQMLSNLFLVSPFEEEEVILDMPLFTWTPVTPVNPGAKYRIQIVELLADQTPFEAFRSNPIFFERSGLMTNIFQYPVGARIMLPCTRYAWRVSYELDGSFLSGDFLRSADFLQQSEIWQFHKPCDEEEEEEDTEEPFSIYDKYHKIDNYDPSSIVSVVDFKLRLIIDNTYNSNEPFSYLIVDHQGNENEYNCCWLCCPNEKADMGDKSPRYNSPAGVDYIDSGIQKLIIDLEELGLDSKRTYTLRVKSGKGLKDIKFKIEL